MRFDPLGVHAGRAAQRLLRHPPGDPRARLRIRLAGGSDPRAAPQPAPDVTRRSSLTSGRSHEHPDSLSGWTGRSRRAGPAPCGHPARSSPTASLPAEPTRRVDRRERRTGGEAPVSIAGDAATPPAAQAGASASGQTCRQPGGDPVADRATRRRRGQPPQRQAARRTAPPGRAETPRYTGAAQVPPADPLVAPDRGHDARTPQRWPPVAAGPAGPRLHGPRGRAAYRPPRPTGPVPAGQHRRLRAATAGRAPPPARRSSPG